jgi:hypothetical protein
VAKAAKWTVEMMAAAIREASQIENEHYSVDLNQARPNFIVLTSLLCIKSHITLSFWCVQWGKVIGGSVKNLQCYSFGVRFNWCKMIEDPDMQLSRTDQTQPTMANLGPVLRKLSWPRATSRLSLSWPRATSRLSSPLLSVLNIPACNIPFTIHQSNQSNHNPFSA